MSWVKVTDTAYDEPRLLGLSRGVRLVQFEALAWSNRHAAGGLIPRHALRRLTDEPDPEQAAEALVAAGLWVETEDGWLIRWLLDDQPTPEEAAASRAAARARVTRHRKHNAGDHSDCDPKRCWVLLGVPRDKRVSNAVSNAVSNGPSVPTRPDPKGRREGEGESAADRLGEPPAASESEARRQLAKAIREAPGDLRPRFRDRFERLYGARYGRGGATA